MIIYKQNIDVKYQIILIQLIKSYNESLVTYISPLLFRHPFENPK